MTEQYTPETPNPGPGRPVTSGFSETHVDVYAGRPIDRVRWGPIVAGLFTALATLVVLSVLGLAIGLTAYDYGEGGRGFTIGSGIWAIVSAVIAFLLGGWIAARTAAVFGHRNGLINGTMVWVVTIPLMLYLLSGGLLSALGTAGNMGGDNIIRASLNQPLAQGDTPAVSAEQVNRATDRASTAAWWTLVSLLIGLGAAAAGGYVGARGTDRDDLATSNRPVTS